LILQRSIQFQIKVAGRLGTEPDWAVDPGGLLGTRICVYLNIRMPTRAAIDVSPAAHLLKALADPTRLRIVTLLSQGELCVCHIQDALSLSQSNVSRHLRILRLAGIVIDRREGQWVHYRLTPRNGASGRLVRSLVGALPPSPGRRRRC
jgi:ArsR family transcriptional regulator